MTYLQNPFLKKKSLREYGTLLFLSGVFFLPSTLLVGILFLLPSAIIGSLIQEKAYFKDSWNYAFFIFGALILLSTFLQNFVLVNNYSQIWEPISSIIGMGNWIPFIWLFWAFQPYLSSKSSRKSFGLILIAGSFPVLITGYGQYFFNWNGPFETLNGLIVWYQRPIEIPGGLSGLFNNQNYAGTWLNFIWPICIALFMEKGNSYLKKFFTFGLLFSVGFAAFLTFSRNAWLGLLTSLSIVSGNKRIIFTIITICIISFFLFSPNFNGDIQSNFKDLLPQKVSQEFYRKGYIGLDTTRSEIFTSAISLIKVSPLFGTGANSFTEIFRFQTGFWKGHSHNLILELATSYGLPAAIIFFTSLGNIVFQSGLIIFSKKVIEKFSLFDKALWATLFFFLISQLFDIQYFDGKISIVAWILISSLKKIIEENNKNTLNKKKKSIV